MISSRLQKTRKLSFKEDYGKNQKTAIQEMDETIKRRNDEKLVEAVKLVNEAIVAEYKRLEDIAKTEEGDPILIEGETTAGYLIDLQELS